ncbi:MAG: terminase [bacterium]|nr:terminase [bacterium]
MSTSTNIIWKPQAGSQALFMTCPIYECLYEGTRGPGKTDALIMDYAQDVGRGYGEAWRGILFRRTYKQLEDVIAKTKKWFFRIFLGVNYNKSGFTWSWPGGEELLLRHMDSPDDYWNYHGHEYPWIGWEELTNWPTLDCYESMKACCRSSNPDVPRKYRATCNPYGVGHNVVKARFVDPGPPGTIIENERGQKRVRLHGNLHENKVLLEADPEYILNLQSITNEAKRKAWLSGDWDIISGGALDDIWDRNVHVIDPFPIPGTWKIYRSFDWGSSEPFSVGWWAESDGSQIEYAPGKFRTFPKGTAFRIREYYGWNGKPDEGSKMLATEVADEIVKIEKTISGWIEPGPADASIYDSDTTIAADMLRRGVEWVPADKRPGSRPTGLEKIRDRLKAGLKTPMEEPGLFVFSICRHFIRTVPVLQRDTKNPDDVDTSTEDHVYDETRYFLTTMRPGGGMVRTRGI